MPLLSKVLRAGEGKTLKGFQAIATAVNEAEPQFEALSDDELKAKTPELKGRLDAGASLEDIQVEAFAVVREAAKRVLGQRHYDVQVIGAAALHKGMVAEMKTGEGKTLVSTMPAYLNALGGKGVHMVTVNDYLASRDADWMGAVHRFLGLSVGLIQTSMTPCGAPARLRLRHHLRDQQRARFRLPARQHGDESRGPCPARSPLCDRRRGGLDPHRRGEDPIDHLGPGLRQRPVVPGLRQDRPPTPEGPGLSGRRAKAPGADHRGRASPWSSRRWVSRTSSTMPRSTSSTTSRRRSRRKSSTSSTSTT